MSFLVGAAIHAFKYSKYLKYFFRYFLKRYPIVLNSSLLNLKSI